MLCLMVAANKYTSRADGLPGNDDYGTFADSTLMYVHMNLLSL